MEKVQAILLLIIIIIIAIILFIIYNKIFDVVYVGFGGIVQTFFFCIVISYIITSIIFGGIGCNKESDTKSDSKLYNKSEENVYEKDNNDTYKTDDYSNKVDNSAINKSEAKYTDRFKVAIISSYYYNDEEVKAYLTKDLLNEINNRYTKYILVKGEILENVNINFDYTYSAKIKFDENEYVYPQLSICTKEDGEKIVIIDPLGFSTIIDRTTNPNVKYLYQGLFSENIESMKVIFAETDTPLSDIDKNMKVYILTNEKAINSNYNEADDLLNIGNDSQISDYIFSNSDTTYLSDYELENLDKNTLALARNEIFARHGYVFSQEPFVTYFNNKVWYTPNPNFKGDDSELNQYEIANYKKILEWENK